MLLYVPREQRPRQPLRLRFAVWRRRARLDAALAAGCDPQASLVLAVRAEQLTSARSRLALARTIENLLDAAEEPPGAWRHSSSQPPLQRDAVLSARTDMLAIADRLRGTRPIAPRAAALVAGLVWDSASPIYASSLSPSLADSAAAIREAIEAPHDSNSGRLEARG